MTSIPRDAQLVYVAGFVRSATVSLVGVTLAIHLADVGFSTTRIGLLNAMVWTHLPSSLLLIAAPASPNAAIAAALFLARETLVEMDVPTRQSYVMAIVKPTARTFASGGDQRDAKRGMGGWSVVRRRRHAARGARWPAGYRRRAQDCV